MQDTIVRVVADPQATANNHIIHVEGPAGTFESRIVNAPSPENPKSSYIVGYSVLNAIHRHFSPLQFAYGLLTPHDCDGSCEGESTLELRHWRVARNVGEASGRERVCKYVGIS